MVAQQVASGCNVQAHGRTTTRGLSRSASALARFSGKRIAALAGSSNTSTFVGVRIK